MEQVRFLNKTFRYFNSLGKDDKSTTRNDQTEISTVEFEKVYQEIFKLYKNDSKFISVQSCF